MRILHLGDSHLGLDRRCLYGPVGWTRADDHRDALAAALAPALRAEVDLVIHAGDLFDRSRPPAAAVDAALALLREAARRVPVVVLAGNHDRRGLRGHLGPGEGELWVVDGPTRLSVAGLVLALVPHHRQAEGWAAAARQAVGAGADLLVTHQAFAGVRVPGFTFRPGTPAETVSPHQLPSGVAAVLGGHIHPRQALDWGGLPIVYPGSTERASFSEADHTKGVAIWTWEGKLSWRFQDLQTRPMLRLRQESDLDGVQPGCLVGMAAARLRSWGPEVGRRGGRLALPPAAGAAPLPQRQLALFTEPAGARSS